MTIQFLKWLAEQEPLECSQFVLDWQEETVDKFQLMEEDGVLPSEGEIIGSIKYNTENIIEILNPALIADKEFFNLVLTEINNGGLL